MASINQACGRMVARRTGTRRTPVSARMLAASAALLRRIIIRRYAQPPRPSGQAIRQFMHGCQVMHPCGQHLNAHGHAIRAADQMQTPSKELLPFGGARPAACAPAHLPTAPGAHTTADWQGEAIDDEPVARGEHLPQHVRNPDHPISELMEATIEARDADPPRQIAAPVHDLHRPFVMTANILGGDDGNRQNLGVGDLRTPPVPPRARGGSGGCDAPGVPSTCQSRQKRL
jgi:hypothetical protein